MPRTRRAADVAVGFAADPTGRGIAYAAVATGAGRDLVRVPFGATPLAALGGLEFGFAAAAAVAKTLRARGFERVRIRVAGDELVAALSGRTRIPPPLAMAYVRTRCELRGFGAARVERAEPVEITELERRARAELAVRAAA